MFFVLQSAEGVEKILPDLDDLIKFDSDMRLQDAHGLPGLLFTPGIGNRVHRLVPDCVSEVVSNASLFLFRIKSPRLRGRRLTTPITLSSPSQAGELGRMVFASFTASDIALVAGPKVWIQSTLLGSVSSCLVQLRFLFLPKTSLTTPSTIVYGYPQS